MRRLQCLRRRGSLAVAHGPQGARAPAAVMHGLSCLTASGIFPVQGSNPCPLHWQVGSYPLYRHERSRVFVFIGSLFKLQAPWV